MPWEFAFLDWIQAHLTAPWLDRTMVFFTCLGNVGFIWILTGFVLLLFPKYRRHGLWLLIALAAGALLSSFALKPLIARIRPFDGLESFELLIAAPRDFSFPSGHTLASVSSAIILWDADKRLGAAAWVLAALIALSRLYLYVHFPTDILAGAALGAAVSIAVLAISKRAVQR